MLSIDHQQGETDMTGEEAFKLATNKARYGHKSWIVWADRNGAWNAMVESASSVKQAMLDVGTQGRWTAVSRNNYIQRWRDGCQILRNARVGVHPNSRA
jgi:hypothetical protein